jgi:phage FluMu protein Com
MSRNYSGSKCPSCKSSSFEMVEETPTGSAFIQMFVRCSDCKTVIGLTEYQNIGALINKLAKKMGLTLD